MLWSVGRFDLRLSEEEFWGLVPRQFYALTKRLRDSRLRAEYGPAMIAYLISKATGAKKVKLTDFMPSWQHSNDETSWQDQLAKVKAMHHAFGGS